MGDQDVGHSSEYHDADRKPDSTLCGKPERYRSASDSSHIGGDKLEPGLSDFLLDCMDRTQPTEEGGSISNDGDRDHCDKLNVAPLLTANNQPDVRLAEADDMVRDTSAFKMVMDLYPFRGWDGFA